MTTLTVNIIDEKDLSVLQEILNRFGLTYKVDSGSDHIFSKSEIDSLLQTRQDYVEGKTTAREWTDIERDLNSAFN
ncbi:hypothetical protein [Mucilaginibacter glaciei]|uniref:Addiction module component n=1 Tax=Mucilaginibacter glaciei TaxID=2772109 RepID=A0A926S4B9_9SPHI|nr:hypothetical protein [Mucilaginibacter glaciei]MBD1391631.1 hypothetical protein [Mucilaginibacter glaciei]